MNSNKNVKTYKASQVLLQKAGRGPIDELRIEKAQKFIEENKTDFKTLGLSYLENLSKVLEELENQLNSNKFESQKQSLVEPVMRLKAHAGFFDYPLIGNLANITLNFIESLKALDQPALKIVSYFNENAAQILEKEMSGSDVTEGTDMISNLTNSCANYKSQK